MRELYFVRHGESLWNLEDKICGATDAPLTEKGHEQAVKTGKVIADSGIQADGHCAAYLRNYGDPRKDRAQIDRAEFRHLGGYKPKKKRSVSAGKAELYLLLRNWRIHVPCCPAYL